MMMTISTHPLMVPEVGVAPTVPPPPRITRLNINDHTNDHGQRPMHPLVSILPITAIVRAQRVQVVMGMVVVLTRGRHVTSRLSPSPLLISSPSI